MKKTAIKLAALISVFLLLVGAAEPAQKIAATVTMIDADTTPAVTPGPGPISGDVALDYNYRTIFVALEEPTALSSITLKCDPRVSAGEDVKDAALPLEGKYRYVKLDFTAREKEGKFELCEVDIWGEKVK